MTKQHIMTICDHQPPSHSNPGSWDVCRMCALEVFISDSTRNVQSYSEYELWIYCISCGRKEMEESKPEVAPYSAEQIEEIVKAVLTLTEGL